MIDPAFFAAFPDLRSVEVSEQNEHFSSHNGMLFDEGLTSLLLVPEGMEGAAVLPDTLATVPACVLSRCTKLSAIVSADPSGSIGGVFTAWNGILYNADKTELLAAPAGLGASASIAPECERIAEGAFLGNEGLRTITSGDGVSVIAAGAKADGATELPAFESEAVRAATVLTGNRSAWEAAGFTSFAEPAQPGDTAAPADGESGLAYTLLESGQLAVAWVGDGAAPAKVDIPSTAELNGATYTVAALAEGAFKDQTALEEVAIPATVSAIGPSAFEGCSALRAVSIPGSVADIPARAFAGCTALENIALAEGVRTIGQAAFESTAAAEIEIPASVSTVESNAFAEMANLKSVFCVGNVSQVDNAALAGDSGINIYTPQNQSDIYPWPVGLAASGNHLRPYGAISAQEVIRLGLGQNVDLFEHVSVTAPEGTDIAYSYNAKTLSVDPATHTATAKGYGKATVNVRVLYKDAVVAAASADVVVENTDQPAADAEDGSSDEGDESERDVPFASDIQEGGAEAIDQESQDADLATSDEEAARAAEEGEASVLSDDGGSDENASPEGPMTSSALDAPSGKGLERMLNVFGMQNIASSQASMPSPRAGMTFTISTHIASDSSGVIASTTSSTGSYMGPLPSAGSFTVSATLKSGLTASRYSFEWTASIDGQNAGSFIGIADKNSLNTKVNLPAGCGGNITLTISATSRYSSLSTGPNAMCGITAASVSPAEYENNKSTATTVRLSATQASGDQGAVSWTCSPSGAAVISGNVATIPAGSKGNITFTPAKLYSISAKAGDGAATARTDSGVYPHLASPIGSVSVSLTATAKPGYTGDPTWSCNIAGISIVDNKAVIPLGTNKNITFTATYADKETYTLFAAKGTGAKAASVKTTSYQVGSSDLRVELSATAETGYIGYPTWTCTASSAAVTFNNNGSSNAVTATIKAGTTGNITFTAEYKTCAISASGVNANHDISATLTSTGKAGYSWAAYNQSVDLFAEPGNGYTGVAVWSCVFTATGRDAVESGAVVFQNNGQPHVSAYIAAQTTGALTFIATYTQKINYSISFAESGSLGEHSVYIPSGEDHLTIEDTWFEFTISPAAGYTGTPTVSLSPSSITAESRGSGTYYVALDQCTQDITITAMYTSKQTYTIAAESGVGATATTANINGARTYQVSDVDQRISLTTQPQQGYVGNPTWTCDSDRIVIHDNKTPYAYATVPAGATGDLKFRAEYTEQGKSFDVPCMYFEPVEYAGGFDWNNRVSIRGYEDMYEQSGYSDLGTVKIEELGDGWYEATIASYGSAIDDKEPSMVENAPELPAGYRSATWAMDTSQADAPDFSSLSSQGGGEIRFEFKAEDYYSGADIWNKIWSGEESLPEAGLGFNVRLLFTPEEYSITTRNGDGAAQSSASPNRYAYDPKGTTTIQLQSTALAGYAGNPIWTSSDTNIATVSGTTATIKTGAMGAVTFTVSYEVAEYGITVENGAGSRDASTSISSYTFKPSGSTRVSLSSRAAQGYKGNATWSVSGNNGSVSFEGNGTASVTAVIAARTTGDLVFTANYSPIEYYVFFDGNGATGGNPPRGVNAVYDQDFTIDFDGYEELSKYGYVFDGWALSPDGEKVCGKYAGRNLTTEDGKSVCLYAHFTPLTTSVEWRDPEGIITSSPVSSAVIFTFGEQIPDISDIYTEPTATRVGYRFDGWWWSSQQYYDAKGNRVCTDAWPQSPTIPSDITLVAMWRPVTFTMQYTTDAPGMGLPYSDELTYKGGGQLAESSFTTDASHQFDGWLITFGDTSKKYLAGASIDGIIEELGITHGATVMATAQWAEKTVTQVTINWHDGSGANPVVTTPTVGDVIVPPANPAKDGSVFMGWGVAGSSVPVDFTDLKATVDVDYYAIWDQPWFTISFRGDGTRYAAQLKQFDWVDDAASIKMADRYANKVFGVNGDNSTLHMWVKYGEADAFSLPEVLDLFELAGAMPDPQWLMGSVPLSGGAVIGSGQPGAPSFETLYGGTSFRGSTGAQLKACFNPALALTVPVRADIQLNADDAADAQNNGCDLRFTSGSIAPIGIAGLEERSSAADKAQFDARMKQVLSEPDFTNAYLQIADTGDAAKGYKLMLAGRTGTLLNEAKPLVLDAGVGKTLTARYSLKGYDPAHLSVSTNMKVANLTFTYQIEE